MSSFGTCACWAFHYPTRSWAYWLSAEISISYQRTGVQGLNHRGHPKDSRSCHHRLNFVRTDRYRRWSRRASDIGPASWSSCWSSTRYRSLFASWWSERCPTPSWSSALQSGFSAWSPATCSSRLKRRKMDSWTCLYPWNDATPIFSNEKGDPLFFYLPISCSKWRPW